MATALHVYLRDKREECIAVELVFYGEDEAEADRRRLAHLAGCEAYAAAEADGRAFEELEDVDSADLPCPEDFEDDPLDFEGEEVEASGDEDAE